MKTTIDEVFNAIREERNYQDKTWAHGPERGVLGAMQLLDYYRFIEFPTRYKVEEDDPRLDVPLPCLDTIRKMTTILIRCMEANGIVWSKVDKNA